MVRIVKVVAIVQARSSSVRLPGKVMRRIGQTPLIGVLLKRLLQAKRVDQIVVATSDTESDRELKKYVEDLGFHVTVGHLQDVLSRYVQAVADTNADVVVRITGDCPLVDADLVDAAVDAFVHHQVDYLSNVEPHTYPDGLDIEVFWAKSLQIADLEAKTRFQREHVTPYLRCSDKFTKGSLKNSEDLSAFRWTVDEGADLAVIRAIFEHFAPDIYFGWREVLALQKKSPHIFEANKELGRNDGALMGTGQKLWKHAKRTIPGGNMLLSKRPEMFLPDYWPAYFSKAKGCRVWDLDGNEFIDMSLMGVGTNILGYANPLVDKAVIAAVQAGNMSTLNCPEEVYLADKLVEMHPWADQVKFARTGGEANAIAVRIGRAASGRDGVAICGYHGWHDWYLSANLSHDENLNEHLLAGLDPKGVPKSLQGLTFPFEYNNINQLKQIVETQEIGVIKMEVARNSEPNEKFLKEVRTLATENNIVLVFDECTSGFRQSFGGLHKLLGIEPDMAVFGKALGNGYAITAIIGRREIMEVAQSFSSAAHFGRSVGL